MYGGGAGLAGRDYERFVVDPPPRARAAGCYANAVDYRFAADGTPVYLPPDERAPGGGGEANARTRFAGDGNVYLEMLRPVHGGWVMIEYGRGYGDRTARPDPRWDHSAICRRSRWHSRVSSSARRW